MGIFPLMLFNEEAQRRMLYILEFLQKGTTQNKLARMYRGRRGFEALLPTLIYHFVRLSRGAWRIRKIVKRSLFLTKTNRFEANSAWKRGSFNYGVLVSDQGFAESSTLKLYRLHFIGHVSHFPFYWGGTRQSPTGLFFTITVEPKKGGKAIG